MKKIGILAIDDNNGHGGGVYQYTQSIIDALKKDKTNIYIVFCYTDDNRFDNVDLKIRKIDKPKGRLFEKVIKAFQCLLFIRKPLFFTKKELKIFSDIDLFLSPAISICTIRFCGFTSGSVGSSQFMVGWLALINPGAGEIFPFQTGASLTLSK